MKRETMMQMAAGPGITSYAVVPRDRVSSFNQRSDGAWVVLGIVTETRYVFPPPPGQYHHDDLTGRSSQTPMYDPKLVAPVAAEVPLFIMGRRRDDELVALRAERAAAEKAMDEEHARWTAAEHKLRTVEKERDDLRSAVETLGIQHRRALAEEKREREQCRKLEGDLAIVRREVGEAAWKRMLPVVVVAEKREPNQ